MLCEDYSSRRRLRKAWYSLLTIAIGFFSCSIIAVLAYYTFLTIAGNIIYCSLWTDIPGRLALFFIFYYAAGICGTLPIPERFQVNCLLPPFILYRLETWRNLLGNLCLLFKFNCRGYKALKNDPEMSPPEDECNERNYDSSPTPTFHDKYKNIQISNTDMSDQSIVQSNRAEIYRDAETASSYEDFSMSFDSSMAGYTSIVPMVKGISSKPRYISDSSITTSESTGKSLSVDAPSDKLYQVSETLNNRVKAVAGVCEENDTPPRTPEIELRLPRYPRVPFIYLRTRSGVPHEAKALHKRNLVTEKQEIGNYNKRQKVEETTCSPKDSEQDNTEQDRSWITDSDEFKPFANRPLRTPLILAKTKTGFRDRTITTPGSIRKLGKMKTKKHKRVCSCSPPHRYRPYTTTQMSPESGDNSDTIKEDKCSENSPDIQTKVEHMQKTPMKFDRSFQTCSKASTSRQIDIFPSNTSNSNTDGEASTSRQNIDVLPSKISDSSFDADVFPSNTSNSNTGGEALTSRQNMYYVFPSKISDSNVASEASASRQNIDVFPTKISDSNVGDEASTSRQDIDNFPDKVSDSNDGGEASTSKQNTDVFPSKISHSNSDE